MTTINLAIGPLVALIAGVLILIIPRLLNYIVAVYLILIGLIGVFGWGNTPIRSTALDGDRMPVATVIATAAGPAQFAAGLPAVDTRVESDGGAR